VLKLLRGRSQRAESEAESGAESGARRMPRVHDDLMGLLAGCRRGDARALATLLSALGPPMLQMIRRVMGGADPDVEDVFQEAMLSVTRALPSFRGECSTRHFGCRIATLTALKARRRRAGIPEVLASGLDDDRCEGLDAPDWALSSCRRRVVRQLLDELPAEQAETMTLHYLAGLTVEEVASAVRVPVETVRSRLRLAKAALRERVALDPSMSEVLEDKL
jgi:RNA polymerase sigma-70 factor (ECF subfamily)